MILATRPHKRLSRWDDYAVAAMMVGLLVLGISFAVSAPAGAFDTSCSTTSAYELPTCPSGSPSIVGFSDVGYNGSFVATASGAVYDNEEVSQGMSGHSLAAPIVGVASFAGPDNTYPYWLVAADGGVFAFQATFPFQGARFYGSMAGKHLDAPMVGMAATGDGGGYWLVAADGGVFAFGDADFYGSMAGKHLNSPVVGMAATADGGGYWLVAADGGVFAFGDAVFDGSMAGKKLDAPVVAIAATGDGNGYYLAAADGGVFAFGDALFAASAKGLVSSPVVGIAAVSDQYEVGPSFVLVSTWAAVVVTSSGEEVPLE
jgi:hypothetical protein